MPFKDEKLTQLGDERERLRKDRDTCQQQLTQANHTKYRLGTRLHELRTQQAAAREEQSLLLRDSRTARDNGDNEEADRLLGEGLARQKALGEMIDEINELAPQFEAAQAAYRQLLPAYQELKKAHASAHAAFTERLEELKAAARTHPRSSQQNRYRSPA